jgi:nucleotide-binding universal stress UspA family protein
MKILTIYDGTIQSKTALQYGLRKAQEKSAELIVLQVFQASLFLDYDAGPRAEEVARAEAARHRRDAEAIIAAAGDKLSVRVLSEEGEPVEETVRVAKKEKTDIILSTPRYKAITGKAGCPVYIMPGTILVPIDSSDALKADLETITSEAKASGSKVLLLGVVPAPLYGAAEKAELVRVQKKTAAAMNRIRKALSEQGIEASETVRSGYPDEEILKAADEFSVSLIMLPAGGKTPSELTKAAAILLDEPERVRRPVYLMPAFEA